MKQKQFISLVLTAAMMLSLTACSGKTDDHSWNNDSEYSDSGFDPNEFFYDKYDSSIMPIDEQTPSDSEEEPILRTIWDVFDYNEDKSNIEFMAIETDDGDIQKMSTSSFADMLSTYGQDKRIMSDGGLYAFDSAGAALAMVPNDDGSIDYQLCDGGALEAGMDNSYMQILNSKSSFFGLHLGTSISLLTIQFTGIEKVESDLGGITCKYELERDDYRLTVYTNSGECVWFILTVFGDGDNSSKAEEDDNINDGGNASKPEEDDNINDGGNASKPENKAVIWDIIPEIPVTDADFFEYKYDTLLEGTIVTNYIGESPEVRIPEVLDGHPVVQVNFLRCSKEITTLIMPDSVNDFELSNAIKEHINYINIPKSVTKIVEGDISSSYNLIGVYISDGVAEIGFSAFSSCTSLTNIYIPDSVTTLGGKAFECAGLTNVTLSNNITTIGDLAFCGCKGLTSITIPDSVTEIGQSAFSNCTNLTSVTIPNSVTKIEPRAFEYCSSLTSITIPNGVTVIDVGAFQECESLTSVTIPNSVTKIGNSAFTNCKKLENIIIPDSITKIEEHSFSGCENLSSVTIPDSVTEICENAFISCSGLTSVTIPNSVAQIGSRAFANCTSLTAITLPDSVTIIHSSVFYGCTSLTSVTIPNSVTTIDGYAFKYCTSLTTVTIPDSVTKIDKNSFEHCEKMTATYKGKTYDYEHIDYLYQAADGH